MKIMIAIPSYTGLVATECMMSIFELVNELSEFGVQCGFATHSYNGNIADARNKLCHEFLYSDHAYTHILFIDDDMGFHAPDIFNMIYPMDAVEVFAALCPRKNMETGAGEYDCYDPLYPEKHGRSEFQQVDRAGTGIMLIPRGALDRVETVLPVYAQPPEISQFFVTYMGEVLIGEDYYFCDRLAEAGVPLYVAMWTKVTHTGRYVYKGNLT